MSVGTVVNRFHLNLFVSSYYYAGATVAQMASNTATVLWSLLILATPDVLYTGGSSYAWIERYINEDVLAFILGSIAWVQIIWLVFNLPPLWMTKHFHWGSLGYGILSCWWTFVALNATAVRVIEGTTVHPAAGSLSAVIAGLAFFSFVSVPKPECRARFWQRDAGPL